MGELWQLERSRSLNEEDGVLVIDRPLDSPPPAPPIDRPRSGGDNMAGGDVCRNSNEPARFGKFTGEIPGEFDGDLT